ncbi:YceI family protein [Hydrogenophaga sp. IBVHS2]|uniref:YceI family protein n=1 Tax=Hydrogenophaga sp. IBVHS2 TaxID=1985170 RepID=UPI000A2E3054|nr:YceI family protein [Hydrogenophaga sp. IBVHS2]OSZ63375.1 polyisoprenoid-binding protein [Hydrogenophaga sp. IBVHS2]
MRKSLALLAAAASIATVATTAQAADYAVDPTHTFVTFEIGHFNTSTNRGRFDKKEGSIQFDRAARTGKVDITIDVASVNTGTAAFDKHLNSADLFNTAVHPKARFVSDKLVFNGDKVVEVPGQFTFMGKTAPLTLKAVRFNCYDNPMLKREVCGGDFEAVVDRTVYGMDYAIAFGVPKDVRLVIQVEAVRQ